VRGFSFKAVSLLIPSVEAVWEKEFDSIEGPIDITASKLGFGKEISAPPSVQQDVQTKPHTPQDADELARTAGLLIESVRDEVNPKFQNSQFMGLMKQLRDREVVVEGDKMVEKGFGVSDARWANDFQIDVKGKGREVDMPTQEMDTTSAADQLDARRAFRSFTRNFSPTRTEVRTLAANQSIEETVVQQEEDPNDAYFRQENAEYAQYWHAHHTEPTEYATVAKSQSADWDRMQRQWDQFEASSTGIEAVDNYQFQVNNPYLLGDRSRTRQHMAHLHGPQSFYEVCSLVSCFILHRTHSIRFRVSWSSRQQFNGILTTPQPGMNWASNSKKMNVNKRLFRRSDAQLSLTLRIYLPGLP